MATLTKQFSYNTDLESWAATTGGATGLTMARDTTEDSSNDTNAGTGVMQARRAGKNLTDGTPYWEWAGTWEDLGVPAGATVTAVDVDYDSKCSEYTTGATSTVGPAELRDNAAALRATLRAADNVSATSAWVTRDGSPASGLTDASNTSIRLRIGVNPKTGNSSSAAVTLRLDWVVVTVTYTPPPTALPFSDSFDRADGAPANGWTADTGTWAILSNLLRTSVATAFPGAALVQDFGQGDVHIELTVSTFDGTDGASGGILLRYTDINNWWRIVLARDGTHYLQKYAAAVVTTIGTSGGGGANGDVLSVDAVGNSISAYVNGVLYASTTDSHNAAATKHGITNTVNTTWRLNDFAISAKSAGSPPPTPRHRRASMRTLLTR